jgi:putative FmdB family regulatory protein
MPVYEYICEECEKTHEVLVVLPDPVEAAPLECPSCGFCGTLRHKISRSRFELKGRGWHATEYPTSKGSPHKTVHAVGSPKGGDDV